MTTSTCEYRSDVLAALAAERLMATPELMEHVGACSICGSAVAGALAGEPLQQIFGDDGGDGQPTWTPGMTENEAALLFSGFGEPPAGALDISEGDRRRLHRVAQALDAAALDGDGPDSAAVARLQTMGLHLPDASDTHEPPRTIRAAPAGRSARWALFVVAAAAAIALAVGLERRATNDEPALVPGESSGGWVGRPGTQVDMELALADRRCITTRVLHGPALGMGEALPCRWRASTETFTMNVRVEPEADARYVAVLARDEAGEVTVLYPRGGGSASRLRSTYGRQSERCADNLCWLEGGRYDVAPGRLSVVAIFSTEPLPTREMKAQWAPARWTGPERLVQRFELEVVP